MSARWGAYLICAQVAGIVGDKKQIFRPIVTFFLKWHDIFPLQVKNS